MKCPACGDAELDVFFEGGSMPVFVNVLHETADEARDAACGVIRLGSCEACGLIHNTEFEPELVQYAPGYENSLHGSPVFQEWARELSADLVREHSLAGRPFVEVGGGRGEFAELLVEAGAGPGLVLDPSAPEDACGNHGGYRVERRLFGVEDGAPDTGLILSRHVLEHLADPSGFVALLSESAWCAGAGVYVEVPNGLWTLRDLGIWDVIYEHCSYFTPRSLRTLFASFGVRGVTVDETFHGQFLGASARRGAAPAPQATGCDQEELEHSFAAARRELIERWSARLADAHTAGRRLALWGAGSKGATFLNTLETAKVVACAVDVNPRKQERFIAGTGHRIVAPADLAAEGVDGLIVLNPAYSEEVLRMAREAGSKAELLAA